MTADNPTPAVRDETNSDVAGIEITESPVTTPPSYWMDTYTDEDGVEVPGHLVDMSQIREITYETKCQACCHVHAVTTQFFYALLHFPVAVEKIRDVCRDRLIREVTEPHTAPPGSS